MFGPHLPQVYVQLSLGCFCLQLRDADNLNVVTDAAAQPTLIAVAAWFPAKDRGTVRLIDNMVLGPMPS